MFLFKLFWRETLQTFLKYIFLDLNLENLIVECLFLLYHPCFCKISKRLKINSYVINQMFKIQIFVI